ncbi:MAG: hypothetical protein Q4A65_08705, partial [Bacillota bacterium]|nr:hypothetical protein [Bacillota bacterium]
MTETMIIIIVAGVVIIAFGVLCVISILRAQRETQGFNKRMAGVEKDLGNISELVTRSVRQVQQTEQNISQHLQQVEENARREAEAKALQAESQSRGGAAGGAPEAPIEEIEQTAPEEIDINDLLDDLEDVLPEIAPAGLGGFMAAAPVQQVMPQPQPVMQQPQQAAP